MLELASFVGSLFIGYCAVVGAYIILRWGFCGCAIVWRMRERMDEAVRNEVEATVKADAA